MLRFIYILCALFITANLNAQIASSSNPLTLTSANLSGSKYSWANVTNSNVADSLFATSAVGNNKSTNLLVAANWGFTIGSGIGEIPSNAVINGIKVEIKMKGSNRNVRDKIIRLRKQSNLVSVNKARANTAWPQTAGYIKFGSSSDMWGTTWTVAELANPNFGVEIAATGRRKAATAMIDHVKITVYFNGKFYHSKSIGDLSSVSTWGLNIDGSGVSPVNFTDAGQYFILHNRATTSLTNNLTITGLSSKMIVGDGTNPTTLTIPSSAIYTGEVDVANSSTLNILNTTTPSLGSIDENTTIAYAANGNQIVEKVTFYNLTIGGTGTKTLSGLEGDISIDNTLTINANSIFNNAGNEIVANGNIINNGSILGSAYIWLNGSTASTISGNGSISNLKIENDIGVSLSTTHIITDTLHLSYSLFNTNALLSMNNSGIVVRDEGTISNAPISTNYDVQYIGIDKNTGPEITGNLNNLIISLTDTIPSTVNLTQGILLKGDLKIESGSLDVTSYDYNISVKKNVIINGTLNNRNNTVTLDGAALQIISGNNPATFNKLNVNNTSGLKLQNQVLVNNTLTLTNGIITTDNTFKLTFANSAITIGASNTRYINGPISKTFTSLVNTFAFPIGGGGLYRPVVLDITQLSSTATTYTVEMINSAPPAATLPSTITRIFSSRYYKVSKSAGANVSVASVTLSYDVEDGIQMPNATKVAQRIVGNWIDLGGSGTGNPSGKVKSTMNFTTFNEFVLADNLVVLPVSLVSFKGALNNGVVKLQWITGNEINVDRYQLEKSINDTTWTATGMVKPNSGSQLQNTYSFNDNDPQSGVNYYRLKIIDNNNTFSYSKVVKIVNQNVTVKKLAMYPNVISNQQSMLVSNGIYATGEIVSIKIFNSNGHIVQKQTLTGNNQIPLTFRGLPAGMYTLSAQVNNATHTSKFVVIQ